MRGKYITKNIMLACLSKPKDRKRDIHIKLKETIAERKEIIREWEKMSQKRDGFIAKISKDAA